MVLSFRGLVTEPCTEPELYCLLCFFVCLFLHLIRCFTVLELEFSSSIRKSCQLHLQDDSRIWH